MEDTEAKKTNQINILAALIIVMSLIIIALSASYAYFMNVVKENKGVNITSGELTMSFATANEQYINNDSADLLDDDDVLSDSNNDYTEFSVTLPASSTVDSATYFFYLTDLEITQNFKNKDVKWALFKNGSTASLEDAVASGDFSTVNIPDGAESGTAPDSKKAKDYSLMYKGGDQQSNFTIKRTGKEGTTDSYKLYIWLSNDPNRNQVGLLNGSLIAKVAFKAVSSAAE